MPTFMTIRIRRYESFTRLALLDIGIVSEPSCIRIPFHTRVLRLL